MEGRQPKETREPYKVNQLKEGEIRITWKK
jgi:hypothetical protein